MPQIKIREPKTDNWKTIIISQKQFQALHDLNKSSTTRDELLKSIENLDTSPELKSLLETILDYTIEAGGTLINVGKSIVSIILNLYKNFPKGSLGLIVGFTIGKIISNVPILGWALKWLIVPLSTITGAAIGTKSDIEDKDIINEIKKRVDSTFSGIKDIQI